MKIVFSGTSSWELAVLSFEPSFWLHMEGDWESFGGSKLCVSGNSVRNLVVLDLQPSFEPFV